MGQLEEGRGAVGGLHGSDRALSDPDFRPESAVQRDRAFGSPEDGIRHSNTFPDVSSSHDFQPMDTAMGATKEKQESPAYEPNTANGVPEKGKEKDLDNQMPNGTQKDESSSNTLVAPDTDGKPRRRRGIKGLFKKKDHQEESTDDEDSGKPPRRKFTAMSQIRATVLNSYINVLLFMSKE